MGGYKQGCGARGRNRTGTVFLPRDFKSLVSTNFTTRANCHLKWRLRSESNRRTRSCSPLHNHSATQPIKQNVLGIKKPRNLNHCARVRMLHIFKLLSFANWSGKPGSNRRPVPWQGTALPTELFPRLIIDLTV